MLAHKKEEEEEEEEEELVRCLLQMPKDPTRSWQPVPPSFLALVLLQRFTRIGPITRRRPGS